MAGSESQHTPWGSLKSDEQARVTLALSALCEFYEGLLHTGELLKQPHTAPALTRYAINAQHYYLDSLFVPAGEEGLLPVLRTIGRADLAEELKTLLDTPIGTSTFGVLFHEWRNTALAHRTFRVMPVFKRVFSKFDLSDPKTDEEFFRVNGELIMRAVRILDLLQNAYPEALAIVEEELGGPVDKSPRQVPRKWHTSLA